MNLSSSKLRSKTMTRCGSIIVAMTADGVIGLNGKIPWHYSADLKRFKKITLNSTVIMGRKTWESLPIKPLPKRQNIVLTRSRLPQVKYYSSIDDAVKNAKFENIWFIGGSAVYESSINYCQTIDITYVPDTYNQPDLVRFPKIDWSQWQAEPKIQCRNDNRLVHQRFTIKHT